MRNHATPEQTVRQQSVNEDERGSSPLVVIADRSLRKRNLLESTERSNSSHEYLLNYYVNSLEHTEKPERDNGDTACASSVCCLHGRPNQLVLHSQKMLDAKQPQ